MSVVGWVLLVSTIIYACLGVVAFVFPRARENWTRERKETLHMALSATVFLMLLFLLWYVSAVIDWPPALTIIIWVCAISMFGLLIVGIFVPRGIRLTFKKKETKIVEED